MNTIQFQYQNKATNIHILTETSNVNDKIQSLLPSTHAIFITDSNVASLYKEVYKDYPVVIVPEGEECKSISTYETVCRKLLELKATKNTTLIALGGGTVGDLTGFVASTLKRGLKLIQIPTTIIAQVDSAIGGKNALNLAGYKNQMGTIYQPDSIIVSTHFLHTLPLREFNNGMAEVIKYAMLFDQNLYHQLETKNYDLLKVIEKCIQWKGNLTEMDEFDHYERSALNFGHTIGHAIEYLSDFNLKHGEAIAWGMLFETRDPAIKHRLRQLLEQYQLLPSLPFSVEAITDAIFQDKKRMNDQILMVEIEEIGRFKLQWKTLNDCEKELLK